MKREEEQQEVQHIARIFPVRMKAAMEDKEINVYRLSFDTGIHESTLRAYLSGSRMPKVPHLAILTRVLDESADWLIGVYDRENPVRDVISPSYEEILAMTAIAVENSASNVPTFVSIANFSGISKQRIARIVKRLAIAGWVNIDQKRRYTPGGLTVTQRYYDWEKENDDNTGSTDRGGKGQIRELPPE